MRPAAWQLKLAAAEPSPLLPAPERLRQVVPELEPTATIAELAEAYLTKSSHRLSFESDRTYRVALKAASRVEVDGTVVTRAPMLGVTPGWAQRVHDAITSSSGGATADKLAKLLGAAHRHAACRGTELPPNPWSSIERYGSPQLAIHFPGSWLLDALDVVELATTSGRLTHPEKGTTTTLPRRVGDFFTSAMAVGARPWCELLRLRWVDLDPIKKSITFAWSKGDRQSRGPRIRTLPLEILCPRALDALERQRSASPYVWPGRNPATHAGATTFAKWWVPFRVFAAEHLLMSDAHGEPLDLYRAGRHAFASHLGELGLSAELIADFLGHRDQRTQRRYVHLSGRRLVAPAREIANSLQRSPVNAVAVPPHQKPGLDADRLARAITWLECRARSNALLGLLPNKITIQKPEPEPGTYSARTILSWKLGDRTPSVEAIHQIAWGVSRPVGWLFGEGDDSLPDLGEP